MTTKNLALAASIRMLVQHNYAAVYHHKSFEFGERRAADEPWSARATAVASGSRARITSYSSVGRPSGAASS
jgi:hypothetical protein